MNKQFVCFNSAVGNQTMHCGSQYGAKFESDRHEFMKCSSQSLTGFGEKWDNGAVSVPVERTPVMVGEKGKKVKASRKSQKKINHVSETKAVAALKSHSEAERRRRERINAHLESLRSIVPSSEKMDKATLLAEVISQVKQLRATASRASKGLNIPKDTDAVDIEVPEDNIQGSFLMKASLCCDYTPDLLSNIKQGIGGLPVEVLRSEMSTLGGRVKIVFLITTPDRNNGGDSECIVGAVRRVLSDILDKVSACMEYDQLVFPRKRQRVSSP